jgi:hypothetical protein
MPLLDHFRPPLTPRYDWHSFHNAWATTIAYDLNRRLPPGYFAAPNVQYGIEIDVGTYESGADGPARSGGTAAWTAPAPNITVPLVITTDIVRVQVHGEDSGAPLVAAIELVSPSNKDRPASRDAFAEKCADCIRGRNGLIVVDVVTVRLSNLHDQILSRLAPTAPFLDSDLYAAAYHPTKRDGENVLEIWQEPLAVGKPLPTLPLWLRNNGSLPVDLESTYEETCRSLRLPIPRG